MISALGWKMNSSICDNVTCGVMEHVTLSLSCLNWILSSLL